MIEDVDQLLKMLEKKVVKYPGQLIETRFNEKDAIIARNSCARVIYGKLFDWIVGKVNHSIGQKMNESTLGDTDTIYYLGLLDIFGFESFK